QKITQQILRRTDGRIQMLNVKVIDNEVEIRGLAQSYYLKQLALQGALEALTTAGAPNISLNIQLGPPIFRADAQEHRAAVREFYSYAGRNLHEHCRPLGSLSKAPVSSPSAGIDPRCQSDAV